MSTVTKLLDELAIQADRDKMARAVTQRRPTTSAHDALGKFVSRHFVGDRLNLGISKEPSTCSSIGL